MDEWGGFVFDQNGNYVSGGGADAGIFNGDTLVNLQPGSGWTTPSTSTPTTQDPAAAAAAKAAADKAAADARTAAAINGGYDQIFGVLNRQLGDIPGQIDSAGRVLGSQFDSTRNSIESAYGRGAANLQYARDDLGTKTKRSLRDLGDSVRQSFDSFSTLIGARGAGDSSAPGQLSYALQKAQAQGRTDIYNNQSDQLGQIGLKQGDLDAQRSTQVNQLDSWRNQQVEAIRQQYLGLQRQIETQKANASRDKLLALASLNTDAVNAAMAALSGVEMQYSQASQAIQGSLSGLQAPANTGALESANYQVQDAQRQQMPGFNLQPATGGDSFGAAVPYYKKLQQQGA